jgi:FkbM family methyltransferase
MKVNKLISKNQDHNWFTRITNECVNDYPISKVDIDADELVLDIGCNVGGFTEAYKNRFNNILAIDASSYNIEQYQSRHHYPTLHKAVWSVDGEFLKLKKLMYRDSDTNSGNFSVMEHQWEEDWGWIGDEYEEVETISLETIIKPYDEIGLLKLDVEGAEVEFLLGKDLSKIKWITMELHNFLGGVKQKQLMTHIEQTHTEVFTTGDGNQSHYTKLWKRN